MQKFAVIVAGGSGVRMGMSTPKQFLLLHDKPILMRTIEAFISYDQQIQIILVLPSKEKTRWQQLCENFHFSITHQVVKGGENRSASVRNGLSAIDAEEGLVAIHDGVRPLVSPQIIATAYQVAEEKGNAVASVPLKDSIRWSKDTDNRAVDRSEYCLIQTPQTFKLLLIKEAYRMLRDKNMTDDASVLEARGVKINLIEGDYRNIKITTREDLRVAEALWEPLPL
ncbi:2-C-methyl-D-erythritol 4-phosphate cytidylyltransferase [Catalinimonas niigatensis]|uniref:2-C-methyl-D-erythritol 4-phosphate cytidylyltransferase n=1 Tax=Catalinimonas niigatensis TaxID=1397264 RepID=UPI0026655544|nr:2-C-methyl-D-erythritol 4-phosphate cytidylyltransferase [Catalinimonas niigatensis]WPP52570.1 2-C-methyl-D-erythritol 4-phosphate cytidylyltransferase [Catalinimonas niigatensis]